MKWAIQCADANSGQEFSLIVDADSKGDAETVARKKGLLVSEIIAAGEPAVDKQSPAAGAEIRKVDPVDYAVARSEVPDYRGLRWGATVFRILAYLCYVLGVLALAVLIFETYLSGSGISGLTWLSNLLQTIVVLWPVVLGVLFHVLAEACTALRDIARNSFRAET